MGKERFLMYRVPTECQPFGEVIAEVIDIIRVNNMHGIVFDVTKAFPQ